MICAGFVGVDISKSQRCPPVNIIFYMSAQKDSQQPASNLFKVVAFFLFAPRRDMISFIFLIPSTGLFLQQKEIAAYAHNTRLSFFKSHK